MSVYRTVSLPKALFTNGQKVAVLALGRGVGENGLSSYGRQRVANTLAIAKKLAEWGCAVTLVWTGGASYIQALNDNLPPKSEAQAMYECALLQQDTPYAHVTEGASRSTVCNLTYSAAFEEVKDSDVVVIVSDQLHYSLWRIQYLSWLIFPRRLVVHVAIPSNPASTIMSHVNQVATIILTIGFTVFVKRGDLKTISKRQHILENAVGFANRLYLNTRKEL